MPRTRNAHHRRSRRAVVATTGSTADDHRELLAAAGSGDVEAVEKLCDHHGGALFSLARAIVGDPSEAETVVVDVIVHACTEPDAAAAGTGSLRRELARLTYLRSSPGRREDDSSAPGPTGDSSPEISELARRGRSALALMQFGDHTVDDVADLLGLSVPASAMLLAAGLRDLQADSSLTSGAAPPESSPQQAW